MQLNPYLTFNGECEAAFEFYAKCLGGKVAMKMTYGDSPMADAAPPDWAKKLLHATLTIGGLVLSGADAPPDSYRKPQGFSVLLSVDGAAEADRIFATLAEDGRVELPLQETFWALRFGMVVDRFGTPWMVSSGKPA